jgi:integrase
MPCRGPFLTHITQRTPLRRALVRVRVRRADVPIVPPGQARALIEVEEAAWDQKAQSRIGDLRYRLFWSLLDETGVRLGEALSLQHRDWRAGRGPKAAVAIVPRPHPHGLIPKSGYRLIYVSSRLDRLYSDYVWALCRSGADTMIADWDAAYIFCNTRREPCFGPLRPESVYAQLRFRKRHLPELPAQLTPHSFRHTHARTGRTSCAAGSSVMTGTKAAEPTAQSPSVGISVIPAWIWPSCSTPTIAQQPGSLCRSSAGPITSTRHRCPTSIGMRSSRPRQETGSAPRST